MVDLENKSEEFCSLYARANPLPGARAKVPLLEIPTDEETVLLCESLVVADYVAEQFGDDDNTLFPLLPNTVQLCVSLPSCVDPILATFPCFVPNPTKWNPP